MSHAEVGEIGAHETGHVHQSATASHVDECYHDNGEGREKDAPQSQGLHVAVCNAVPSPHDQEQRSDPGCEAEEHEHPVRNLSVLETKLRGPDVRAEVAGEREIDVTTQAGSQKQSEEEEQQSDKLASLVIGHVVKEPHRLFPPSV